MQWNAFCWMVIGVGGVGEGGLGEGGKSENWVAGRVADKEGCQGKLWERECVWVRGGRRRRTAAWSYQRACDKRKSDTSMFLGLDKGMKWGSNSDLIMCCAPKENSCTCMAMPLANSPCCHHHTALMWDHQSSLSLLLTRSHVYLA